MRAPSVFIVLKGHDELPSRTYLAWFFDEEEANRFAEEKRKELDSEYIGISVEEVPGADPMAEKERW